MTRIVVAGAGIAGLSACRELREQGFSGEIVLLEREMNLPVDRPPLSKQILLGAETDEFVLPDFRRLDEWDVSYRSDTRISGLEVGVLHTEHGDLSFDGAIIATGTSARRWAGQEKFARAHTLGTVDDALRLRADLVTAGHLIIVGAGFIGMEVASAARSLGIDVTVIAKDELPLARSLGKDVAQWLYELHDSHGVQFRTDTLVQEIVGVSGRLDGVRSRRGEDIAGDTLLFAVGAEPNTSWLAGSQLRIRDGVCVNAFLQAAPGIYAIGDVARWQHPLYGEMRSGHWSTAIEHARIAVANLQADLQAAVVPRREAADIPYFWTDHYGLKIQVAGWPEAADEVEVVGGAPNWIVRLRRRGTLVAVVGVNQPVFVAKHRRLIASEMSAHRDIERESA